MPYQIPDIVRSILEPLAEAVFPIGAWTAQKQAPKFNEFIPPIASVPWRATGSPPSLSTTNFAVVKYLELMIDSDSENEALAPRWQQIKANPASFFKTHTGQPMSDWRASRKGLDPSAKFAPFDADSNNFAFWIAAADGSRDPVSRRQFYEACWEPLEAAYRSVMPADPIQWTDFSTKLLANNQFPGEWPTNKSVSSAAFTVQFTIDTLTACLGQKNPAIAASDPLWQRAVLIEIGENRHPDYPYGVPEAEKAVDTFVNTI